jgi:hypothetical protein
LGGPPRRLYTTSSNLVWRIWQFGWTIGDFNWDLGGARATAMIDSSVMRVEKAEMVRILHAEPTLGEMFAAYLLTHNSPN